MQCKFCGEPISGMYAMLGRCEDCDAVEIAIARVSPKVLEAIIREKHVEQFISYKEIRWPER